MAVVFFAASKAQGATRPLSHYRTSLLGADTDHGDAEKLA